MKSMRKSLLLGVLFGLLVCVTLLACACGTPEESSTEKTSQTTPTTTAPITTPQVQDEKVTYTVLIQDQNGNPVEGVEVQVCEGDVCKKPNVTDAEGVVTFKFVPNGEELKVQINGDNSVSGYVYPTEKVLFAEGETTITITIEALSTYTVSASDLFGNKIADMAVTLYNEKTNEALETKVTGENGAVSFTVAEGVYSVKISHVNGNPAYIFTNPDEEGGNKKVFGTDERRFDASIIVSTQPIPYTLTVLDTVGHVQKHTQVALYNEIGVKVGEGATDENGVVTIQAVNGNYYATALTDASSSSSVVSFEKNGTANGELTVSDTAGGTSEEAARYVFDTFSVKAKQGKEVWLCLVNGYKKQLIIESNTVQVVYNGQTYTPDSSGKLIVHFTEQSGEKAIFRLTTTQAEETLNGILSMPGSYSAPIALNSQNVNGQTLSLSLSANETVYYSFVAHEDGTISAASSSDVARIFINDQDKKAVVSKGETVVLAISTYDSSTASPAADFDVTLSYKKVYVNYTVKVLLDSKAVADANVTLYRLTDGQYTEVARALTGSDGTCVFADRLEANNYFVSVSYSDYETFDDYIALQETTTELLLNHVADGSYAYPFEFSTDSEGNLADTRVDLLANTSVWYSATVPANYTLLVSNRQVSVKIYRDTNGNLIPDQEDTPVVLTWDEKQGAYVYQFGQSTINREQCLVEIRCSEAQSCTVSFDSSAASAEGGSLDNAISVTESGSFSVTVTNSQEVYYVYLAQGSGKVTVTCNETGATLTVWTRSLAGAESTPVTSGTHSEKVIANAWFYFSIGGEDGTYTVTFTAELD